MSSIRNPRNARLSVAFALVFVLVLASLTGVGFAARPQDPPADQAEQAMTVEPLPSFNIRLTRAGRARGVQLERKKRAMAVKPAAASGLVIRWNDELDLPHHLFSLAAPMTGASSEDAAVIAKRFVRDNSSLFDVSLGELDESRVSARSVDAHDGLTRVALEQRVNDIRVFDSEMIFLLDREGRLVAQSGSFIPQAGLRAPAPTPALTAEEALAQAARFCRLQITRPLSTSEENLPARKRTVFRSGELDGRTEASLAYYPVSREEMRLAYQVLIYTAESITDSYLVIIDAHTGELLKRDSLTYFFQMPMGRVFTDENPVKSGGRGFIALAGDAVASPRRLGQQRPHRRQQREGLL